MTTLTTKRILVSTQQKQTQMESKNNIDKQTQSLDHVSKTTTESTHNALVKIRF